MKKNRIMIVDDSPFSISILKDILEEHGFDVVGEAGSLEETVKIVKEVKPDLVTMDMTIPGTDGLECTRAIHKINSGIKVIIVSSMKDDEIVKKAIASKVSGYVQKPVDPEELILAIQRALAGDQLLDELEDLIEIVFKESLSDGLNRIIKKVPVYQTLEDKKGSGLLHKSSGISAVIGIIGKCSGRMVLDMSYDTARAIVQVALKREAKSENEVFQMVGEVANMVAGNACSMINRKNKLFGLRLAPPTIYHGESLQLSTTDLIPTIILAQTDHGELCLNIGFKKGDDQWM